MFGRHESCRKVSVSGRMCPCDCGDKHGVNYKPGDLNTPIHLLTMKVAAAHKKGERYEVEAGEVHEPVVELNYRASEPLPKVVEADVDDTLEELEAKRE